MIRFAGLWAALAVLVPSLAGAATYEVGIRNCIMRDSGNGFFVSSGDTQLSRDILVERNYIYDNGIEGSIYQHNNRPGYTAAGKRNPRNEHLPVSHKSTK